MKVDFISLEFLIEVLLKSGVVLALGLLGTWAFRRSTPEFRHRLWMPLFVIVLVAPVLLLWLPRWEVVPALQSPEAQLVVESTPINFSGEGVVFEAVGSAEPIPAPAIPRKIDWKLAILVAWSAGVVFLGLRMGIGCWRVALWRRRARSNQVPEFIKARTEQLRMELGISRPTVVMLSEKVRSPFAWGWYRPMVALPVEASEWDESDLEMILRHELTHLARRDSISVSLAGLVTALNWPNPLAWVASKRVTELREQICDREVLNAGCDSERYATLLFGHARRRVAPFPLSATAVARPGTLEKRIAMILKSTLHPSSEDHRASRLGHLFLLGFMAISFAIVFLGMARPALAEEEGASGNARLVINTSHDPKTAEFVRLNFELNDQKFGFDQLEESLRPIARENTVLALVPRAPLPMKELKRVIEVAEAAGIRSLIFENPPKGNSDGHGDPVGSGGFESEKQILVTTRFVEIAEEDAPKPSPLLKKLNAIIIPEIEFVDTPLADAFEFLQQRSVELDQATPDPNLRGVNFVIKGSSKFRSTPITLKLRNVSLAQTLQFVSQLAKAKIRVDENAVFFQAATELNPFAPVLGDDPEARALVEKKLKEIVVPSLEFKDTPLGDALMFLRARSVELDETVSDPDLRGINIVRQASSGGKDDDTVVTLQLKNVTLGDAIRYVTDLVDYEYQIQGNSVVVHAIPVPDDPFGE